MLVVSRKPNEGILLIHSTTGERIHFLVDKASSGRARVGVEASQNWKILRTPDHLDKAGNPPPNLYEKKEGECNT